MELGGARVQREADECAAHGVTESGGGQKGANARWFETNSEHGMKKMRIWKAKINEDPAQRYA